MMTDKTPEQEAAEGQAKAEAVQEGRRADDDGVQAQDPMADHPGGDADSEPTGAGPSGGADAGGGGGTGDSEPTGAGPSGGA
jgi:hypothetical protein